MLTCCSLVADSPDDFFTVNRPMSFAPLESKVCIIVVIINDEVLEQAESFSVIIKPEKMHSHIELGPRTSTEVVIRNEDGQLQKNRPLGYLVMGPSYQAIPSS